MQQYSRYSFFGGILKTSGVTPFIAICKSRLNLVSCSASCNFTIIADKLMKFAGHLVMVMLIKSCGKNLISEQKFFSRCILKTAKRLTILSGICTLQLHYHKIG